MTKQYHMCVDIKGLLKNTRYPSGFRGLVTNDDGETLSPHAAREYMFDCLAKGWRVLPTADCDGFDYQTGCPGHQVEDEKP